MPDLGGFFLLPRIVGLQRAKEIVFTTRVVTSEEAERLGIVYSCHEPDQLKGAALALAQRFWPASTEAIGLAKVTLNQAFHLDQNALIELEAAAQAIAFESDYNKAAVQKFLAKEPPPFNWD